MSGRPVACPAAAAGETVAADRAMARSFSHQVLFYESEESFLAGTVPFVSAAVEREEPVLVAVTRPRARALKGELGERAELVKFAEMEQLGRNPGRIIPAWQRFVQEHAAPSQPVRGIGEPIWHGRTPAELVECRRHEALLNVAFADTPAFQLLCPYDTCALDDEILEGARRTHPYLRASSSIEPTPGAGELCPLDSYVQPHDIPSPFEGELPGPDNATLEMRFDVERLPAARQIVAHHAAVAGLSEQRISDLVLSVNELAANSVSYAGGRGLLRLWRSGEAVVCEVCDEGALREDDPLLGRRQPSPTQLSGRGLWLAHQLCDLVQVRSGAAGTVVRVHVHAD